jgi:predicted RNA-binding protein with TRAM domain
MVITKVANNSTAVVPLTNCVTYQVSIRAVNSDGNGTAATSWRGVPSQYSYWMNNDLMQFGVQTNAASNAQLSAKASVNQYGSLEQPFYYNGSAWYKLTYSSYPLDLAIGVGGTGTSEWNTSGTIANMSSVTLEQRVLECAGFNYATPSSGSIAKGTGKLTSIGRYSIGGATLEFERSYTLEPGSRYLRIDETIRNVGTTAASNVRFWVGTRDDYIGPCDNNYKTRGNISDTGVFSAIASASTQSKALKVNNWNSLSCGTPPAGTAEKDVVYFYTTSNVGYTTGLDQFGDFTTRVVNKDPSLSAITVQNDGSYGMFRRFPDLSPNESDSFTWYYVASTAALADSTVSGLSTNARPGAPDITGVTPSDSQLSVAFTAGSAGGSAITNYEYALATSTDGGTTWSAYGAWTPRSPANTTSPLVISGLTNGTYYKVKIRALNSEGGGSESDEATAGIVPAPTITAITPGSTSVTVTFTAPTNTGGSDITNYQYSADGGTTWNALSPADPVSPITVSGLTEGTTYNVSIRAVNSSGTGVASTTETFTTGDQPAAPTISSIVEDDRKLTVAFATGQNGGSPLTNVEYSTDGGTTWFARSPTSLFSPLVITKVSSDGTTSLVNGTTYSVKIRAVNTYGAGTASSATSGTPKTRPAAPSITGSSSPVSQSLSFTITAGDNGGSSLTNYEYSTDRGATWRSRTDSETTGSPITITKLSSDGTTDLTNGTEYCVQVRAVNAVGSGAASSDLCATPKTVPAAPASLSITSRDRSVSVAFTLGANGGAAISEVEYSTDNGVTWTSSGATTSPIQIGGLTNGTTYTVRLRAKNSVGNSDASDATSASVEPADVPSAPTITTITESSSQLSVAFTAPSSDGGETITLYQYSTDNGTTWRNRAAGTTASPLIIATLSSDGTTTLVNGTTYSILIRAVSAAGNGVASAAVAARPSTTPGAPTSLTAEGFNTRIVVTYSAPASDGGLAITRYEYQLDSSTDNSTWSTGTWVSANTASTSFTIRSLTNTTYYRVKLRAVNDNGSGTETSEVSASPRPLAVPESPVISRILSSSNDGTLTSTQLSVTFEEPASNGSSITNYQYSTDNGTTWKTREDGRGRLTPLVISNLSSANTPLTASTSSAPSSYTIRIRAVNANGNSPQSDAVVGSPGGDITAPTVTLAVVSATSSSESISFTVTGNEAITCSTLSTTAGTDFTLTNISSIDSIAQTSSTVCTVNATSSAIPGGGATVSTLTAAGSFSMTDTAGNAQTTLTGSPKSVTVTLASDSTAPTVTLAVVSATSSSVSISFTVTGNEAITCSTLSTTAGADFTLTNISSIDSIVQTSSTVCTVNATSSATAGGGATVSTLTAAGSFSMTDTAGNAQTTLTGSPKSVTVTIAASDSTAPTVTLTTATIGSSGSATVSSTETGTAYLVNTTVTVTNKASITSAADASWNQVTISAANTNTSLSVSGLSAGTYKAYAVDSSDNLSAASSGTVTIDTTAPTVTLAASAATSSSVSISFTVTGNEDVTCSTLSTTSGTDFSLTNISSIDSIVQTSSTVCTVNVTSSATAGGGATVSTLTAAASFSMTDTAGNVQTTLTGSPKSVTVTIAGVSGGSGGGSVDTSTTTTSTTSTTSTTLVAVTTTIRITPTTTPRVRRSTTTTSQVRSVTTFPARPAVTTTTTFPTATTRPTTPMRTTTSVAVTTSVLRPVITIRPIVISTTTTVAVTRTTGAVTATTSKLAPRTTITASSAQNTTTTLGLNTSQLPVVRELTQQQLLQEIGKSAQNVQDLSLPVYVSGELPNPSASEPISIQSGEPSPVNVAVINEQAVQLESADGFAVRVNALDSQGEIQPLRSDGAIEAVSGNRISVNGRGLSPRSQAVVWMFSTPTRLGVISVSISGEYSAEFEVGENFDLGEHTVQVNGISEAGEIRSMNLELVLVGSPTTETETAELPAPSEEAPSMSGVDGGSAATFSIIVLLVIVAFVAGLFAMYLTNRRRRGR